MGYNRPTVSDFKQQFPRDFPFGVPAWGGAGLFTMVAGVITAVGVSNPGYGYEKEPAVAVQDVTGSGAQVTAQVDQGVISGFTVVAGGTGYRSPTLLISGGAGSNADLKKVRDQDITDAFADAEFNMNEELFQNQNQFARAYNYLSAHLLVEKLMAAGEGLASQYNWLTTGKSVGGLSASFEIPDRILKDPMLSHWSTTRYGAMFLQIISPLLIGNMATQFRQSLP